MQDFMSFYKALYENTFNEEDLNVLKFFFYKKRMLMIFKKNKKTLGLIKDKTTKIEYLCFL